MKYDNEYYKIYFDTYLSNHYVSEQALKHLIKNNMVNISTVIKTQRDLSFEFITNYILCDDDMTLIDIITYQQFSQTKTHNFINFLCSECVL
jgi:hypothetical protein